MGQAKGPASILQRLPPGGRQSPSGRPPPSSTQTLGRGKRRYRQLFPRQVLASPRLHQLLQGTRNSSKEGLAERRRIALQLRTAPHRRARSIGRRSSPPQDHTAFASLYLLHASSPALLTDFPTEAAPPAPPRPHPGALK